MRGGRDLTLSSSTAYDTWHIRQPDCKFDVHALQPWHKTAAKLLPDLSLNTVLEIGCGAGDFAFWLARKYPMATLTGTDFSNVAIEKARRNLPKDVDNLNFSIQDAQHLTVPSSSFDWVIACECLEHVSDPQSMVLEMARVLKPEGRFILTTENYFNGMALARLNAWFRHVPFDSGSGAQPIEHFLLWWKVKKLLEACGLCVEYMESNHFVWLLLPRFAPNTFFTTDFENRFLKRLFRPFGRHFTFLGRRPKNP